MLPGISQSKFNFKDLIYYLGLVQKHMRLIGLLMASGILVGLNMYVYKRPTYRAEVLYRLKMIDTPLDSSKIFDDGNKHTITHQMRAADLRAEAARRIGIPADETERQALATYHIPEFRVFHQKPDRIKIVLQSYEQNVALKYIPTLVDAYLDRREAVRTELKQEALEKYSREIDEVNEYFTELFESKFDFEQQNRTTLLKIEHGKIKQIPRLLIAAQERLERLGMVREQLESLDLTQLQKIAIMHSFQRNRFQGALENTTSFPVGSESDVTPSVGGLYMDTTPYSDNTMPQRQVVVMPSMVDEGTLTWQDLETNLRRIDSEIEEMSKTFLPGHPKMREIIKERGRILSHIDTEYTIYYERLLLEETHLQDFAAKLEGRLDEYNAISIDNEKIDKRFIAFEGNERGLQRINSQLYNKLQDVLTSYDRDNASIEFLTWLEYPDRSISISKSKALGYGLILGLGLSIVIPFLLEYLDHTVNSLEGGEELLKLTGLGIVPKIDDFSTRGTLLLTDDKDSRILMENIRSVRSHLLFSAHDGEVPQVIMLSSACPREGKSFISSNMAVSFANVEEKTLLIDCDLRRGRLDMLFGVKGRPGVKEVLRGEKDINDVIYKTVVPNLYLLPVGLGDRSNAEILVTNRLSKIFNEMRTQFDRIIVDSPPILGISDATVLQKHVDTVVMVIASNQTAAADAKNSVKWLRQNGANLSGFILNKLDLAVSSNYYQYYYYSKSYYEDYTSENVPTEQKAHLRRRPESLPPAPRNSDGPYGV